MMLSTHFGHSKGEMTQRLFSDVPHVSQNAAKLRQEVLSGFDVEQHPKVTVW